jgi:HSP20 family protein
MLRSRGVIFFVLESQGLNFHERGIFIMAMSFDPFSELDRLTGNLLQFRPGARFMPVDLYRDEEKYVLTADLPGIDPGSVDVDVDGQLLTIRAERTEGIHESVKWLSQERPYGSYLRQFNLGDGTDPERISASYDNGVLTVTIPIAERAKPRKIQIAAGHKLFKKEQSALAV